MSFSEKKSKLRTKLLQKREAFDKEEYKKKSEQIIARLQTLDALRRSRTIHCYISMNSRREVNTHPFVRWMLASNKRIVVPINAVQLNQARNMWNYTHFMSCRKMQMGRTGTTGTKQGSCFSRAGFGDCAHGRG
ncbi:MAG: 5-formyltetrahydrofolate cyclo-ligase [Balneolaceae bacterium]|nr:5-formyltetrahydrofolate cyclo-ligase [Balneolaceae bacterium]